MSDAPSCAICGSVCGSMSATTDAKHWADRVEAILDVTRAAGASAPPPPGLPFFGLDHPSGTPLVFLEDLATRGIFRKYEHVLDLGGGLGATTRYLVARLGCTATATGPTFETAHAGRTLTARAGLDWQVRHVVATPTKLPFAEAAFTHVWVLETLAHLGPCDQVLSEARRVLRPGGNLAMQELALRRPDERYRGRFVTAEARQAELERSGFVEIVRRDVGIGAYAHAARHDAAWVQLTRRLGASDVFVEARRLVGAGLAAGDLGITQLTARRP